jgi:hypothetical protein
VLNVIGRLVGLEPSQADVLERVCADQTISADELRAAGALTVPTILTPRTGTRGAPEQPSLLN